MPSSTLVTATTLERAWRDEFPGTRLSNMWNVNYLAAGVPAASNGMTVSVASSKVTIATGTTSGDVTELVSAGAVRAPARIYLVLDSISQRIANQEFSIELVEQGAATDAGNNRAGVFFSGTVATTTNVQTWSGPTADTQGAVANASWLTTTAAQVIEIDLTPEEVWFYTTAVDSTSSRSTANRFARKVPDPTAFYQVRIRAKNTGTAASNTNFIIDSVVLDDYATSTVELIRSRASTSSGESLPVNGTTSALIAPSATSGGTSTNHHLVSAATTNATSVKASSGSIGSLVMTNTSAAAKFVKLFNKASAPTVGTDTPTVTFLVPATTTLTWDPANYYRMSTGIAYAITGAAPDLDATVVAAGDVILSLNYA